MLLRNMRLINTARDGLHLSAMSGHDLSRDLVGLLLNVTPKNNCHRLLSPKMGQHPFKNDVAVSKILI